MKKKRIGEVDGTALVKILWDDAFSLPDDWYDVPLETLEPHPMISVGYLVRETDWAYAIAHTRDLDEKACCGVIVIPKPMVKEVIHLGT